MKYLDFPTLARINAFLEHVDVGEAIITGNLEAYSCKLAGLDKKLSKSLDADVQLGSSPLELSKSPVGPLSEAASRKTLIYLILTLNHIYPDYDFSTLRAHHFRKESGSAAIEEEVDSLLLETSKVWENTPGFGEEPFLDCLWSSIDEAICLKESDVYSYQSDHENDPFGENGSIWSFNYFFYNRKLKRILYLSARGISKAAAGPATLSTTTDARYNSDSESEEESKYGMAGTMDL